VPLLSCYLATDFKRWAFELQNIRRHIHPVLRNSLQLIVVISSHETKDSRGRATILPIESAPPVVEIAFVSHSLVNIHQS
jgi:hypothetical protein